MGKTISLPLITKNEIMERIWVFNDKKRWNKKDSDSYFAYKAQKNHGFKTVPSCIFYIIIHQENNGNWIEYWILPGISSLITFTVGAVALFSGIIWSIEHYSLHNWQYLVFGLLFNLIFIIWHISLKNEFEKEFKELFN